MASLLALLICLVVTIPVALLIGFVVGVWLEALPVWPHRVPMWLMSLARIVREWTVQR